MSWLEDAQRGNERLPCWHPLKSGGRGKLFQLGAQLRPCPFGAPPTGTGLSRPKLELCSHAVVLLPFHPWEWYITTNQAKRRANPCEPALSVAIATGYRDGFLKQILFSTQDQGNKANELHEIHVTLESFKNTTWDEFVF